MATTLLDRVKAEMVLRGLARDPRTAAAGKHPVYRQPDGAIAPGQAENSTEADPDLVISLFHAPGVPHRRLESFYRTEGVDVWVRCRQSPDAIEWEAAMRAVFNDRDNWLMGPIGAPPDAGERIISSFIYRELQPLELGGPGHAFVVGYLFQRYFPPQVG